MGKTTLAFYIRREVVAAKRDALEMFQACQVGQQPRQLVVIKAQAL